ncbi:DNA-binding transcriptional regulator DsdC [Vibrio brasiliensis]|uniref:DNA-binding transcriptional regulator DsdC n=1 Tax=Vibrio brasiliensis LMG 20546 TaxID=945543 RepID=E8LRR7_9VIBR|nr:DNA-binding transcriptional regulator DsdC [Vibrio brasiliensis]EGA66670.1 DNA-binding transcriptional regulator DsdC [Vibrio brasiliensis LMG 20546]
MYTKENLFSQQSRINSFQLAKLHTFEVVARHCSFSLAAEELSLTPSAISHRINKLEHEIGVRLFTRTHRKITLTEQGERIYQSLQRTLNDLNQEIHDVKSGDISGPLTVYTRPSFAQCWLVPRIHLFKEHYPSIDLKLLTGNEKINFQGYGIDVAIYFDDHMPEKLFCKEILSETIIPVCTREYADKHQLNAAKENLRHVTLLHDNQAWGYDSNQDEWNSWAQANHIADVSGISSIGFDRSDLALVAALNNAGVAMGRYSQIKDRLSSGELVTPFPDTQVLCKQKYYVATSADNHSPKVKLFIEWLEAQAKRTVSP